mgnify:CR=1 FL=1
MTARDASLDPVEFDLRGTDTSQLLNVALEDVIFKFAKIREEELHFLTSAK